jgi:hypothetical protein
MSNVFIWIYLRREARHLWNILKGYASNKNCETLDKVLCNTLCIVHCGSVCLDLLFHRNFALEKRISEDVRENVGSMTPACTGRKRSKLRLQRIGCFILKAGINWLTDWLTNWRKKVNDRLYLHPAVVHDIIVYCFCTCTEIIVFWDINMYTQILGVKFMFSLRVSG